MLDAILSFACDLERGVERTLIRPALLTGDSQAHTFRLTVTRGGGDAAITGASVAAYFVRADGVTVPITGSLEGSVAVVTLPEACYRVPGRFQLVVKLSTGSGISTVFWGDGAVAASSTDTILDEEDVIPSLDELLAQIAAVEAAASNASSAASAANSAASSANTAASRADAAAASIEQIGAQATTLTPGSEATAAWSTVDGAKVLTIGVPQGIQGPQGPKGEPGKDGSGSVSTVNGVASVGGNVTLTASDVGARADTWVPTASEVGALPEDGTAADAAMLGGKAPAYYLQPRNLLDNSNFRSPVNQRGASSYTGNFVRGIDRWLAAEGSSGSVTETITDSGVTFATSGGGQVYLIQRFEKGYLDISKPHTIAACLADGTVMITGYIDTSEETMDSVNVTVPSGSTVQWAALYEGSYTADTLPPYIPKGYAAELAECMRYYQKFQMLTGTGASAAQRVFVVLPVAMRIMPTIVYELMSGEQPQNIIAQTRNVIDVTGAASYSHLSISLSADL